MAKKKKLTEAERKKNMLHVFNVLLCPHKWGEEKSMKVRSEKRKKPYDAVVSVCQVCQTTQVKHDGISSLYPPQ